MERLSLPMKILDQWTISRDLKARGYFIFHANTNKKPFHFIATHEHRKMLVYVAKSSDVGKNKWNELFEFAQIKGRGDPVIAVRTTRNDPSLKPVVYLLLTGWSNDPFCGYYFTP